MTGSSLILATTTTIFVKKFVEKMSGSTASGDTVYFSQSPGHASWSVLGSLRPFSLLQNPVFLSLGNPDIEALPFS